MTREKTKNDKAWEILFEEYEILKKISKFGFFEIDSNQINKVRESRLMAKFDHHVNLPLIFRENQLSILPISRSRYTIGNFETHFAVQYNSDLEAVSIDFPEYIESIDCANLYSESSAINCAFNSGIIDDLVGEKVSYTISGRMSTDIFNFKINNLANENFLISVRNSQCEIDAGFESENYLILIEAKNYAIDDFLIRQIYYPYRLWLGKISKIVIPILMTYSNDTFSFFIYKFEDYSHYNSLILIEQRNYVINAERIQLDDVYNIFKNVTLIPEPTDVPFPQADKFERIIDLLSLLVEKDLTKDEITENYQFDVRQTQYYTDAGRYIGLVNKYKNPFTKEITFSLTEEGKSIFRRRHKVKYLELVKRILEHQVFYRVFELGAIQGEIPPQPEICQVMLESNLRINETTIERRSRTVRKWIDWIWFQID